MRVINTKKVKARKRHVCDMCGSNIYPGEEYELQTNEFDNEIYNWKNCYHCKPIVKQMDMGYYPDGITKENFWEFITEYDINFEIR